MRKGVLIVACGLVLSLIAAIGAGGAGEKKTGLTGVVSLDGTSDLADLIPWSPMPRRPAGSPDRWAQTCPDGYPVFCAGTDYCCQDGYSCETACQCRYGQSSCDSGCCPGGSPHTCPESSQCFVTAQDAINGGCSWETLEICAVIIQ